VKRIWPFGVALLVLLAGCSREPEPAVAPDGHVHVAGEAAEEHIDPEQAMSPTEMAEKADVPLYPDADAPDGKSNFRKSDAETRYEIVLTTPDPPEKVLKFYEKNLTKAQRMTPKLMGVSKKGNSVMVSADQSNGLTTITLVSIAMTGLK
jgi:hypothetical protein